MKKQLLVAAAIGTIGISAGLGTLGTTVLAQDSQTYPPIVTNIAEKFNLQPDDVQEVFTETRESKHEEKLAQLVTDGKITEEQKTYIEEHHEEARAQVEKLKEEGKTQDEIHDEMEATRDAFQTWLEDQGIDDVLGGPMGGSGEEGERPGRGHGMGQRGMF